MIFLKKIYWLLKAFLANLVYGFPSRGLVIIGVTGTDGKTSTTTMIAQMLSNLGKNVAYVSTVGAKIGGKDYDLGFHVTTPRFFQMQKLLREAKKAKAQYVVLEVTSHSIDQMRIAGIHFNIAVLTNITNEHLDYHKHFDTYAKTKLKLINSADVAIVNREVNTFYKYKDFIKSKNLWTTALTKKADIQYAELVKKGIDDKFVGFERENLLLAFGVGKVLGFTAADMVKALNLFQRVIGRFDLIEKKNRRIMVDFAHTPNAFIMLYKALEEQVQVSRIIHVFGCAGLRDRYKRTEMGEIAGQHADIVIITEEDYRTEKLADIFMEIEKGVLKAKRLEKDKSYFFVENRQQAINMALKLATKEDLVLLTGKAHEKSLARGKKEYPWDEYKAVETALKTI